MAYLNQMRSGSNSAVLVSVADKYHNALSWLREAKKGTKEPQEKAKRTLWFYDQLMPIYRNRLPDCYLVRALDECINELAIIWGEKF